MKNLDDINNPPIIDDQGFNLQNPPIPPVSEPQVQGDDNVVDNFNQLGTPQDVNLPITPILEPQVQGDDNVVDNSNQLGTPQDVNLPIPQILEPQVQGDDNVVDNSNQLGVVEDINLQQPNTPDIQTVPEMGNSVNSEDLFTCIDCGPGELGDTGFSNQGITLPSAKDLPPLKEIPKPPGMQPEAPVLEPSIPVAEQTLPSDINTLPSLPNVAEQTLPSFPSEPQDNSQNTELKSNEKDNVSPVLIIGLIAGLIVIVAIIIVIVML